MPVYQDFMLFSETRIQCDRDTQAKASLLLC